jgi:CubicO group peptidase (beta-lactamase class C family)
MGGAADTGEGNFGSAGNGGDDGTPSGPGSGDADDRPGGASANAELDALVIENMAEAHMPGLAACLVKAGKVAWCNGYGLADVKAMRPVTTDTVFLIASVSKTVTATTLMQLWEKDAFELDDDIAGALPFQVEHPGSSQPITYRGLLTHTASVRDNWAVLDTFYDHDGGPDIPLLDAVSGYFVPGGAYFDAQKNFLSSPPGTQYTYANMGIALAGYLAEALGGEDFAELSRETVLEPLGMSRTSWRVSDFEVEDMAMPHSWEAGGYKPHGHYTFADYPDGGLRTTAPDLARFLAAMSSGGALDGVRVLEEATVAEMMKIQRPQVAPSQGLVFQHVESGGEEWIGHDGVEAGVAAQMYYRPEDGLGFVLLMNGDWGNKQPIRAIRQALIAFGEGLP